MVLDPLPPNPLEPRDINANTSFQTEALPNSSTSPSYSIFKEKNEQNQDISLNKSSTSLQNTRAQPIHKNELENKIKNSLNTVSQLESDLKNLDQFKKNIDNLIKITKNAMKVVSTMVSYGCLTVPTEFPKPFEILSILNCKSIGLGTNIVDLGTGSSNFIIKAKIRSFAIEELEQLKNNLSSLTPEQLFRLEELEKNIKYEENLFNMSLLKQGIKLTEGIHLYVKFSFQWIVDKGFVNVLAAGADAFGKGVKVVSHGLAFYKAHGNLKKAGEWSEDYRAWIENQIPSIDKTSQSPATLDAIKTEIGQLLENSKNRRDKHINILKTKLANQEIKMDLIKTKIKDFKNTILQNLNSKKLSFAEFKNNLEEKLELTLELKTVCLLQEAFNQINEPSKAIELSIEDQQAKIEAATHQILKIEDECLNTWIEKQSEDSLLSIYVDYQSVLNPVLKNSLAQMVNTKHKIEKNFLKWNRVLKGVNLSASIVFFGLTLTLAVIAPIGSAGLILTILTTVPPVLSFGLQGAGYYNANQLKPRLILATLKGETARLLYYQIRSILFDLHESIKNYMESTVQEKRDQVSNIINTLTSLSSPEDAERAKQYALEMKKQYDAHYKLEMTKINEWENEVIKLTEEIEELNWQDFAEQAQMKAAAQKGDPASLMNEQSDVLNSFDTLETVVNLLTTCDFDMLSTETKDLLENQLGLNIYSLQKKIEKNPSEVKKLLLKFFNLKNSAFVKFIKKQAILKEMYVKS